MTNYSEQQAAIEEEYVWLINLIQQSGWNKVVIG